MPKAIVLLFACVCVARAYTQAPPWQNPLMIAWSADGATFDPPAVFQDSAGVPSMVRWRGDTLICAFQWFRQPQPSPTWDRVAVKFSYDNGGTWTVPEPIVVNGPPSNFQRPFDPTLALIGGDSLRIYYSSSEDMPVGGLDSTVNTYSAVSADGIHYSFEPGARVDVTNNRVIDPAVIHFGPGWHYAAPAGAPQAGAYHYLSPDGINFNAVPMIPSDPQHNWTGNYMVDSPTELRFYGSGTGSIWYNSSPNGGQWNGYVSTNIQGGDPTVLRIGPSSYAMVFVGLPLNTGFPAAEQRPMLRAFPVPSARHVQLLNDAPGSLLVLDLRGRVQLSRSVPARAQIDVSGWTAGGYIARNTTASGVAEARLVVE